MEINKKHYLTKKQIDAIHKLEEAFAECADLGVVFYGMDDDLIALTKKLDDDAKEYLIDQDEYDIPHMTFRIKGFNDAYHTVYTDNSYRDSGGW